MKILRIHIKNLNSLGLATQLDFTASPLVNSGIFAITGDTGAGKSTILDAITLALYGRVARHKEVYKEVMSYGEVECFAEVEFEADNQRYLASWRMHRARKKADGNMVGPNRELARWNGKENAFVAIAEKIREVDEQVELVTGLDYDRFTRSVLLSQGEFAAFLRSDERSRSELLERITGTEIYSQVSKAAFDRFRLEKQQLDHWQSQLQQLEGWAEEPVDEEALTSLQKAVAEGQKQLDQSRTQIQRVERWRNLSQRRLEVEQEKESWAADNQAAQTDRAVFEQAQKLRPLASQLAEEVAKETGSRELARSILELEEQEQTAQTANQAVQTQFSSLSEALRNQREETTQKQQLFQQVERLDQQLLHNQEQTLQLTEQQQTIREELENAQTELNELIARQNKARAEQETLAIWLEKHKAWADVSTQLPAIEEFRRQLLGVYQSREQLEKEKTALEKEADGLKKQFYELQTQNRTTQDEKKQLDQQFRKLLPPEFDPSQQEAVQRLSTAIEELQEKRQSIEQLKALDEEYQQLLAEQNRYDDHLHTLEFHQQEISKQLLNTIELRDGFREELRYKQEIYQQQQLVANYEKDRQSLKPGDPCPLCLSTDHPFHEHPITPFVDRAKAEWEKALAYDEDLARQERELGQEEARINQEISLLKGNELQEAQGRVVQLQERMLGYEERMAKLLLADQELLPNARGPLLTRELSQVEGRLQTWRRARTGLESLLQDLEAHKEQLIDQDRELITLGGKQEALTNQLSRLKSQVKEETAKFDDLSQRINDHLKPLGATFQLETAKVIFSELREQAQSFTEKKEKKINLTQQIQIDENNRAILTETIRKLSSQAQKLFEQLEKSRTQETKLQHERQALLGEQTVKDAQNELNQRTLAMEEEYAQVLEQIGQQREAAAARQRLLEEKRKDLAATDKAWKKLQKELGNALPPLGFTDITHARQAQLSVEQEQAIEQALRALDQQKVALERALLELDKELEQLDLKEEEQGQYDQLLESLRQADMEQTTRQQQLGQLLEKKDRQEKRRQQHQNLLSQIDRQRIEFNRWAALNEIIGQADGKKFRTYAQGLTLQKLVALANHHLEQLNGRYRIHKQADADLALEIVDTYQADNRRSMFTLSGGETFLVSLALALGLSDLAGRHAQIQSLFIDEGFGSLDENSLDLALTTLENLQSRGKTIGIISHLPLLKERIGTRIHIQKHSNGFSSVRVLG